MQNVATNSSNQRFPSDLYKERVMRKIRRDAAAGRFRSRALVKIVASAAIAMGLCAFCISSAPAADEKERSADPLGDIAQDMKAASRWLGKLSTDVLTQETQKDAVDKLDVLIAELEKQAQQFKAGQSSANPNKPLPDSMIKGGPGGMGKLHGPNDDGKHWADLPPHERERILQSMNDGFPAHYQNVLAQYFKRLAEEKPVKADDAPATDKKPVGAPAAPQPKTSSDAKDPATTTTPPNAK
jgi:hypothetical protein